MGAKKKAVAAGAAAKAAKDNPYVNKLIEDDDLRQNIWEAYESARDAVARLGDSKSATKAIFDDKKLQKDLKQAAESIREASVALREAPSKKSGGLMRKLMLVAVAGGLAVALSESLRKKVLDALFGAEEEFEYTSTTASTPPASTNGPASAATSSAPAGSTS